MWRCSPSDSEEAAGSGMTSGSSAFAASAKSALMNCARAPRRVGTSASATAVGRASAALPGKEVVALRGEDTARAACSAGTKARERSRTKGGYSVVPFPYPTPAVALFELAVELAVDRSCSAIGENLDPSCR